MDKKTHVCRQNSTPLNRRPLGSVVVAVEGIKSESPLPDSVQDVTGIMGKKKENEAS